MDFLGGANEDWMSGMQCELALGNCTVNCLLVTIAQPTILKMSCVGMDIDACECDGLKASAKRCKKVRCPSVDRGPTVQVLISSRSESKGVPPGVEYYRTTVPSA